MANIEEANEIIADNSDDMTEMAKTRRSKGKIQQKMKKFMLIPKIQKMPRMLW
jgi:hypothetical protein